MNCVLVATFAYWQSHLFLLVKSCIPKMQFLFILSCQPFFSCFCRMHVFHFLLWFCLVLMFVSKIYFLCSIARLWSSLQLLGQYIWSKCHWPLAKAENYGSNWCRNCMLSDLCCFHLLVIHANSGVIWGLRSRMFIKGLFHFRWLLNITVHEDSLLLYRSELIY